MKFWQIIVAILLVSAIGVGVAVWQPWKASSRSVQISAEGKVKGVPDVSKITAGVEVLKDDAKAAQAEATVKMDQIIKAVKENQISDNDIQTQQISVNPNYDYRSDGQKVNGYYARTTITITVRDIAKAQIVYDAASAAGANSIYGPQLTFSDEKLVSLQEEARNLAVSNAKNKAAKLAEASGARLGKVSNISEQANGNNFYPMFAQDMASSLKTAGGSAANTIVPGENDITISVSVTFSLK
jgi:uncharacterized protein YggE